MATAILSRRLFWTPSPLLTPQAAAQMLPAHRLFAPQAKLLPLSLVQHWPPAPTQMSPQQDEFSPHLNSLPFLFVQVMPLAPPPGHVVSLATGNLLPSTLQHLLPGAAHELPQQVLSLPQGKLCPNSFLQQTPPSPTQTSPQHDDFGLQMNELPCRFVHVTGSAGQDVAGNLYFVSANSQQSSPLAAQALPQQVSPSAQTKFAFNTFEQQVPPFAIHKSPQHSPSPQSNSTPNWFVHFVALAPTALLNAKSEVSSWTHASP